MPDLKEEVENFCIYGCKLEDLDELGMCAHVIGFCTKDPNNPTGRLVMDPLEAATRKRRNPDTGVIEEIETGHLRVNGSLREYVQSGDKLVNPETPQKDFQSGQTHMHWKWFSWRVYHPSPETRVPELVPQPKRVVKPRPKRKPEAEAEVAKPKRVRNRSKSVENKNVEPAVAGVQE